MKKSLLSVVAILSLATSVQASNFSRNVLLDNTSFNAPTISSANYYDQFLFAVQGDCKVISSVWFHHAHSWEAAKIGNDAQGRPVEAWLSIQLFKDGTYWAEYGEHALKEVRPDGISYEPLFSKKGLTGSWRVNGTQIEVSGLGKGVPSKYISADSGKQYDSFKFTLTTKLNDPRAVNSVMNITKSGTNVGPRGISINQFCRVN